MDFKIRLGFPFAVIIFSTLILMFSGEAFKGCIISVFGLIIIYLVIFFTMNPREEGDKLIS